MTQSTFAGTTPPTNNQLALLDANFNDLYGIANYLQTPGFTGSSPKAWLNGSGQWAFGLSTADWTGGFAMGSFYSNASPGRALNVWFANNSAGSALLARVDFTAGKLAEFYFGSGTSVGSITTNGTTTSFNTTSDGRLKQNVVDAGDPGSVLDAIRVRRFQWPDGSWCDFGFVAQELVTVAPDAVRVGDDGPLVAGTVQQPGSDLWGVDPSKLVAMLVAELQRVRARLAALEAA